MNLFVFCKKIIGISPTDITPLFVFIYMCVIVGMMFVVSAFDWFDRRKEQKTMFIKDKDWLLMEDHSKQPYKTEFANTRYIRPGGYIPKIDCHQPVYDESAGIIRVINNVASEESCSISPIVLSDKLKKNIEKQKEDK